MSDDSELEKEYNDTSRRLGAMAEVHQGWNHIFNGMLEIGMPGDIHEAMEGIKTSVDCILDLRAKLHRLQLKGRGIDPEARHLTA